MVLATDGATKAATNKAAVVMFELGAKGRNWGHGGRDRSLYILCMEPQRLKNLA